MGDMGVNKRLETIILHCQDLREEHGFDYEENCAKKIAKYSKEIVEKDLVNKSENRDFSAQLCMMNCLDYKIDDVVHRYE